MPDPAEFASWVSELVEAHAGHGGWIESPEGVRCIADNELVVPTPTVLTDAGEELVLHLVPCRRCGTPIVAGLDPPRPDDPSLHAMCP